MAHLDDIIVIDEDGDGSLTFGIELEFLVPVLKIFNQDSCPTDPRRLFKATEADASELEEQFDKEILLPALETVAGIDVRLESMDKMIAPHDNVPQYDAWRIIRDTSVTPKDEQKYSPYIWLGKEVTSEVMKVDDSGYPKKITDVCQAIRSCRVHLNSTAGVHVHVGRGNNGFTLKTIKRVATIVWLLDDQLIELQHPSRWDNKYCRRLKQMAGLILIHEHPDLIGSDHGEMNDNIPLGLPTELNYQLQHIWDTPYLEGLARLMSDVSDSDARNPHRAIERGAVGFRRFVPAGKTGGNINTIEFRQMAGSLEPDHIQRWIKVCVAVVEYARTSSNEAFKDFVHSAGKDGSTYSALDLLRDIGLSSEVPFWEIVMSGYKAGDKKTLELCENSEHDLFVSAM